MTTHTKIVTTLLIICLSQGNHAETIHDAIAQLTPQIVNLKTNIDTIIQNGRSLVVETRRTIGRNIAEGEGTIHEQLDQLDNILTQAEQEAEEKGVDVSRCVSDVSVALSDVDTKKFESCGSYQDLNLIGSQFGDLRRLKSDLSRSVGLCRSKNEDLVSFTTCVQADIDNARTRSGEIQQEITKVCQDAVKNASTCLEKVVDELDTTISKVAHELKQCVLKLL